jgi:hypothetical protein
MIRTDPSGRVIEPITPPEISRKIYEGLQPAEYDRIQAPALGIFNKITPQYHLPYYWYLDPARQGNSIATSRRSRSGSKAQSTGSAQA